MLLNAKLVKIALITTRWNACDRIVFAHSFMTNLTMPEISMLLELLFDFNVSMAIWWKITVEYVQTFVLYATNYMKISTTSRLYTTYTCTIFLTIAAFWFCMCLLHVTNIWHQKTLNSFIVSTILYATVRQQLWIQQLQMNDRRKIGIDSFSYLQHKNNEWCNLLRFSIRHNQNHWCLWICKFRKLFLHFP